MGSVYKLIGVLALVALATILHNFYIAYRTNADTYILSWPAASHQHERFVESAARSMVRPERTVRRYNTNANAGFPNYRDNPDNGCVLVRQVDKSQPKWAQEGFLDYHGNYRCKKPWTERSFTSEIQPGVSFEQALETVRARYPSSAYGMIPSRAAAGDQLSRAAMSKSLWLGVVLPVTLLFGALLLIVSALQSHRLRNAAPAHQEPTPDKPIAPLSNILKARFGRELGVGVGDTSREAPLVITDRRDYVAIEYAVVKFLLEGLIWRKVSQALNHIGDRYVDELVFSVRSVETDEWTERRFYFDITAGYKHPGM